MPLGIRPTVDFAFKKIFGSPENVRALIGLLNAILNLPRPIVAVEILNPFSYQEFADSKLIVLDVRCRDGDGRLFNVEMQVSPYAGLLQRLVYYACSLYVDQLSPGDNYAKLAPTISICLLRHILFPGTAQAHHRFRMVDTPSGRELAGAIEVHTVELTKYNLDEATIAQAPKLEQWVFLLLRAHEYDAESLRRLFPDDEFHSAIATLETIAAKTEDKVMYDQREKAQRDYEWALSGAREEGREKGREEGIAIGEERGSLIGKVQLLRELLHEPALSVEELRTRELESLKVELVELQNRLRERDPP